jgi:hypothetical protein
MRKMVGAAALALTAAAPMIGLSVTPAFAATGTWTTAPGGSFTASAGQTELADSTTNASVGWENGQLAGSFKSGTGLSGLNIGRIKSLTLGTGSSTQTVAWPVNAQAYDPASVGGTTSFTVRGIHFSVNLGSACSFVVDGTSATADNGTARFKYANSTHILRAVSGGSTLHAYDVSGCSGLRINEGDSLNLIAYYQVSPGQAISSP